MAIFSEFSSTALQPRRRTLVFAAILLASGCASDLHTQQLRESPGYAAGYGDGCITGSADEKSFSTTQERDDYAFDNDEGYRFGWRQGYLECGERIPAPKNGGRLLGERSEY